MKTIKPILILTFAAVMILSGCKENKKKLLFRTWKIEDVKISKDVPEEQKQFFEAMLAQMKQYLRITYKEDGTYMSEYMGKTNAGKWTMNKEENELQAEDSGGKKIKYKIITLTKDKFEYITADEAEPVTFILTPGEAVKADGKEEAKKE